MQNKGLVKFFTVLIFLACAYYLSFSVVSNHYDNKAAEEAGGDMVKYQAKLDSLANDTVYLNYTLRECREKELGLGLDLKGGMNVVMEVSVPDILKTLAGKKNSDEKFVKALERANEMQRSSQKEFLDLFCEAYKEVNGEAPLADVFSSTSLKGKVNPRTSDDEVVKVLKEEIEGAIERSFNVLRSRIDHFGVVQPNIQRLEASSRILIEMPGVKEPERVRKLLQGSANLEFWETTELSEVINALVLANNMSMEMSKADDALSGNADTAKSEVAKVEPLAKDSGVVSELDSLAAELGNIANDSSKVVQPEAKGNSLFSLLTLSVDPTTGSVMPGPTVGYALPKDTAKINEYLRVAKEKNILPHSFIPCWTLKEEDKGPMAGYFALVGLKTRSVRGSEPKPALPGSVVADASADFEQHSVYASVNMVMNSEGARAWAKLTRENIGRCVAVVLDGYVYSYPNVNTEIPNGRSVITGNFTAAEAGDMVNVLKSGKMPAPTKIVQEDVVGPSLGQEAVDKGLTSFIVAFAMVLVYMFFYYGAVPGAVANAALLLNVFFIFGVLASFGAVLTLPGIAGIVLTLGMAVDANVLIYERIREELRGGKDIKRALKEGYGNAMSAIIDSNITTVLTGVILFYFGTGPIKGFATTLIVGVACSFFTAVFVSRMIFDFLLKKDVLKNVSFTTNLTKNFLQNVNFDFIGRRKTWYMISGAVIVVSLVSLFTMGLKLGIDFSGGRNYVVRFEQPVEPAQVRELLGGKFGDANANVITIGDKNQVRISTNFRIEDNGETVDDEIEAIMFEALKPLINRDDVTKDMFVSRYVVNAEGKAESSEDAAVSSYGIQSSQKVGPSVADDITISAVISVCFALLVIGLYILLRFRNLSYSVGAVVSLAHDTIVIMGIFSLFQNVMPFSLEIDQAFIAAILTVIGYSINDNVVVFDRIRENISNSTSKNEFAIMNGAMNSTLSRTFSTSMSTAIVLIIIFIFGGEVIRGFVFAMLIGVIVGTYSTLFVACPISYDLIARKNKGLENASKEN